MLAWVLAASLAGSPDPRLVESLVARAKADDTALVVVSNGRNLAARDAQRRFETHSVTKLLTGLAIGMLIADGKIAGYDARMTTWFPEWRGTTKAAITLRQVLEHTSGLAEVPLGGAEDVVARAASSPLASKPGTRFAYGNTAVALLARAIREASGMPEDRLLASRLFEPLGIHDWDWSHDRAGNPLAYDGLAMSASDLAKIGEVLADGGRWHGKALVPTAHLEALQVPSAVEPRQGLLAELAFDRFELVQTPRTRKLLGQLGLDSADALARLDGVAFASMDAYVERASGICPRDQAAKLRALRADKRVPLEARGAHVFGFLHTGAHGQELAVYPGARLVIVRLNRHARDAGFEEFAALAHGLAMSAR